MSSRQCSAVTSKDTRTLVEVTISDLPPGHLSELGDKNGGNEMRIADNQEF